MRSPLTASNTTVETEEGRILFKTPKIVVHGITVTKAHWSCGICSTSCPVDARAIWSHIAGCEKAAVTFRAENVTLLVKNKDAPDICFARYRRLILELIVCVTHTKGCWWCEDKKGEHPVRGQFLIKAAELAGFDVRGDA